MVKWLKKILAKKLQIGVTDNASTGEQQENGKCFYSQYELFVSHIEVKTMSIRSDRKSAKKKWNYQDYLKYRFMYFIINDQRYLTLP